MDSDIIDGMKDMERGKAIGMSLLCTAALFAGCTFGGEVLYNGIVLPDN